MLNCFNCKLFYSVFYREILNEEEAQEGTGRNAAFPTKQHNCWVSVTFRSRTTSVPFTESRNTSVTSVCCFARPYFLNDYWEQMLRDSFRNIYKLICVTIKGSNYGLVLATKPEATQIGCD